jgi:hypothetical protein
MLQTWNDTDNWNTWVNGIQANGVEATVTADAGGSSNVGFHTLNVTTSLQAWLGDPSSNHGWAWLPPAQDDSWQFDSAEGTIPPALEVTYQLAVCSDPAECDDDNDCTVDDCVNMVCENEPIPGCCNTDPDCDDQNPCTDDACVANACQNTPNVDPCDDGDACTTGDTCADSACVGGPPPDCDDSIACTDDSCDSIAGCLNGDNCPGGDFCNLGSGLCEPGPGTGDVIISGFQATNDPVGQNPGEFIELFNTTSRSFPLDTLEIITRVDTGPDGIVDIDWQLAQESPNLTGKTIAPYSFFLIAESAVAAPGGIHDLATNLNLATGEGGIAERAIGIDVRLNGTHMDHVVYGRADGSDTTGIPPGDIIFDGVSYPRIEVIRNTTGTDNFSEGIVYRASKDALHAGYAANGFYTDEGSLPGSNPAGVWTCPHDGTFGAYMARNSTSSAVPVCDDPVADFDGDCDVDQDDYQLFEMCVSGPNVPLDPGCDSRDFDGDLDGDQDDFGVFQRCLSGSGSPADPACDD